MSSRQTTFREGSATRVLIARGLSARLSENEVWRRVSNKDYRGRRNSLKNHAFRLAPDDITWISICGAFSVLNVSMAPESPKAATCAACEAGLAENPEEQECS